MHGVLDSIKSFAGAIRKGDLTGVTGKPLKNLIVIGIGGSYLSI